MDLEYGLKTLKNLDKALLNKWYPFSKANEKEDDLREVVDLRNKLSGDFSISSDGLYFKRIELPVIVAKIDNTRELSYTIEWREYSGELNEVERNLPEPKWKPYDKKRFAAALGRAD